MAGFIKEIDRFDWLERSRSKKNNYYWIQAKWGWVSNGGSGICFIQFISSCTIRTKYSKAGLVTFSVSLILVSGKKYRWFSDGYNEGNKQLFS